MSYNLCLKFASDRTGVSVSTRWGPAQIQPMVYCLLFLGNFANISFIQPLLIYEASSGRFRPAHASLHSRPLSGPGTWTEPSAFVCSVPVDIIYDNRPSFWHLGDPYQVQIFCQQGLSYTVASNEINILQWLQNRVSWYSGFVRSESSRCPKLIYLL